MKVLQLNRRNLEIIYSSFFYLMLLLWSDAVVAKEPVPQRKYNFNSDWLFKLGDVAEAKEVSYKASDWKK
ncbi:hypothetical protein [Niabella hibiscisoli]|uniref:hypothetical protein n=1 Tax=Niabella hibiscisoli TaxID=1825928 RepID=UPI001F0F1598|nr:hypothetical protein [Niabella hibiscisoli]MCH5718009.1 hypothetical protein [Niabella hibiscisoli]